MDIKPVKLGVLGYGHFIRTNFIKQLKKCSSIEIIGVYNRGEERRKQAEEDGYFATSDIDELLAMDGLEAVLIGTSNFAHKEQAIKVAEAGKHILCEKPIALNLDDINEMVDAAQKAGVITHVNHPSPYTDRFLKLKAAVDEYAGEILHVWNRGSRLFGLWNQGARHVAVANPEESGGWTFHHMCHKLDDVCILLNTAKAKKVFHVNQKSCDEAPSEEIVNSFIEFENGTTALISDTTSIGGFTDFGVQGTKGDLRLLGDTITIVTPGPTDPTQRPGNLSQVIKTIPVGPDDKYLESVGHRFAEAVRGGKNVLLSFEFIKDQYKIMLAMKESDKLGKSVEL